MGAAIALAFAHAGANVALHASRSVPNEVTQNIASTGVRCVPLTADLSDPDHASGLIAQTIDALGSVDILVNNAGITRRAPALEFTNADWDDVIATNLTSVFRLCQLAARSMLENGSGKIINMASLLSFQGGITVPAYAAAKGAVAQITKALANEWAARNIQVNAIAPGYIATELTQALQKDPTRSRQILERIPAGRWGNARDVAGAAVFLASPASDYVNGHILVVDGGWLAR
jgi:2-deoxy-D-gluconate 3-dehydrogenase